MEHTEGRLQLPGFAALCARGLCAGALLLIAGCGAVDERSPGVSGGRSASEAEAGSLDAAGGLVSPVGSGVAASSAGPGAAAGGASASPPSGSGASGAATDGETPVTPGTPPSAAAPAEGAAVSRPGDEAACNPGSFDANGTPVSCTTSGGRSGGCSAAGVCIEYCTLGASPIGQCLLAPGG